MEFHNKNYASLCRGQRAVSSAHEYHLMSDVSAVSLLQLCKSVIVVWSSCTVAVESNEEKFQIRTTAVAAPESDDAHGKGRGYPSGEEDGDDYLNNRRSGHTRLPSSLGLARSFVPWGKQVAQHIWWDSYGGRGDAVGFRRRGAVAWSQRRGGEARTHWAWTAMNCPSVTRLYWLAWSSLIYDLKTSRSPIYVGSSEHYAVRS